MYEVPESTITDNDAFGFQFTLEATKCYMGFACYPFCKPFAMVQQNRFLVAADLANGNTSMSRNCLAQRTAVALLTEKVVAAN